MRRFENNVLNQIRLRGDDVQNTSVLVACSGGGDSVALLACLVALHQSMKLELAAAHIDHGLRAESKEEAAYVKKLCTRLGLRLVSCTLDVSTHATETGQGIETAARELRWAWLKSQAANLGAQWIATGHTIEDHTETVFLRLARGCGPGCLTGLPAVQSPRWSPLIECRRQDLRAYLRRCGIEWREDATNDIDFTPRNRWRKHLEGFRAEGASIDRHLWETHRQVADLLSLRNATVTSWRGTRWDIREDGHIWLETGWAASELAWVLEAAFRDLGLVREHSHISNLSAWVSKLLRRPIKRPWKWGVWSLCPQGSGAILQLGLAGKREKG